MNRQTLSLIAGVTALAAVTGFATLSAPDTSTGDTSAKAAAQLPVERTGLLCPQPSTSDVGETTYTSFTPVTKSSGNEGSAELTRAEEADAADSPSPSQSPDKDEDEGEDKKTGESDKANKPVLEVKEPGTPVTADADSADTPALIGTAQGKFAPGWTVQETTEVAVGTGRGLLGVNCTAPDTEFWFPGGSTAADRTDYVHLTNPDDSAAVVDIELYGKDGALKSTVGDGITVMPRSTEPVLLSTLVTEKEADLTVHVSVRSGRVGAALQALDKKVGGDWLTATADPAGSVVLPGIPEDAKSVQLIAFTPGDTDADLKIRLASPTGPITPAGNESLHIKAGMTATADLGDVTRGEPGSIYLTPTDESIPVVAALRVIRGTGGDKETAYIPATRPVGARATVTDNRAKGTTLALTAPTGTAKVKVTASAGTEGGEPTTKTFTIEEGTTQNVDLPTPTGLKGTYALTVESLSGPPVYASRTLEAKLDTVPAFTIQTLPDDRGTVAVPEAEQDLSILQRP
ncbi:DUF5719 family protein [Streptomyces sp. NPDC002643]